MSLSNYPPVGFHFLVEFEAFTQTADVRFQEVSGLTADVQMEEFREGGENRFTHKLPVRTSYADLTLKRGLLTTSAIHTWIIDAIKNFNYQPVNLIVKLLNEEHTPLQSWYVIGAIPKKWDIAAFNAERSEIVIETLVLSYRYFEYLS